MAEQLFQIDAEKVKDLLLKCGMSLNALSRNSPVDRKQLGRWMKGSKARVENVAKIAKALGVTPDYLIKKKEESAVFDGIQMTLDLNKMSRHADSAMGLLFKQLNEVYEEFDAVRNDPINGGFNYWLKCKKQTEEASKHAQANLLVYHAPAFDDELNQPMYFYFLGPKRLHEQTMQMLGEGDIPEYCVIIAKGYGTASDDLKLYLKDFFGYDHSKFD